MVCYFYHNISIKLKTVLPSFFFLFWSYFIKTYYIPNFRDADNLSPPTPKESYRSRQSKNNSSRCSSSGNKGTIDSPSDSDGFGEEVIYSQKSPKMDGIIRDFDWELGRFVEYRSPLTRKEILSLGSNSSHWNINNSSVIDNQRNEIKKSN